MNSNQVSYIDNELKSAFLETEFVDLLKNKRIYITGASGYIGKWLLFSFSFLNKTKNFNIKVTATSRNILDSDFLEYTDSSFEYRNVDVRNAFDIPQDVDYVIHLAGVPDRRIHASDPLGVISTNIDGTRNVLESASRVPGLKKILVFSSGLIHGNQYVDENGTVHYRPSDTLNFSSSYIDSKRVQENICHVYFRQFQLPVSIVRPYSFIGPLQELDRPWAINDFINGAIRNNEIRILGNSHTEKSYLYSIDMVNGILKFLVSDEFETPLELGSNKPVTLSHSAEIIRSCLTKAINIKCPTNMTELARQDFICNKTNINETVSIEDAISHSLSWYNL
ncbi:hypothetical protein C1N32_12915 [Vibrio diazotrophicus]|uniref:NAD-dependent epimerase/dehydratase domain-containing protein n=1 Tax=Vibrio diazotrophicus TaxID=685 RepID=A0A2J8I1B9_VIBDI|nr:MULTISPECIES: NAD-dependent epimerase/dehydratase family protein [Vibrio]MCF7363430.1 NAD-dependent epimerase/dehydratase family protein [Vibrio sp. A1-b2]PNI04327.1 hypothetical protein C1N32_12915 [Vibrio diazotrophicus]